MTTLFISMNGTGCTMNSILKTMFKHAFSVSDSEILAFLSIGNDVAKPELPQKLRNKKYGLSFSWHSEQKAMQDRASVLKRIIAKYNSRIDNETDTQCMTFKKIKQALEDIFSSLEDEVGLYRQNDATESDQICTETERSIFSWLKKILQITGSLGTDKTRLQEDERLFSRKFAAFSYENNVIQEQIQLRRKKQRQNRQFILCA